MTAMAIYRKRDSILRHGETEWRVEDDELVRRAPDGAETRLKLADVSAVRLRYDPTYGKSWLHMTVISTPRASLTVDNGHFAGIADFENRSAAYSPFVRTALGRIAVLAPGARIDLGSGTASYVAQTAFLAAALIALAIVLIALPMPLGLPLNGVVKLVILVVSVPLLLRWLKANRPRKADMRQAVEDLPAG